MRTRNSSLRRKRQCALPRPWLWPHRRWRCLSPGTRTSSPRMQTSKWKSAQRRYVGFFQHSLVRRSRAICIFIYFFLFSSFHRCTLSLTFIALIFTQPTHRNTHRKQCVKACLDLAPKSDDYCNETCSDECKAMKEDGDEGNTAFSAPEPDEGLQGKINNVLDKGAVFFVR